MSLAKTASILALEVESQLQSLVKSHENILYVMKEMPSYLQEGNLNAWEASYRNAIDDNETEGDLNWRAIELIYDLAGFNLYGAFDKKQTKKIYKKIQKEFRSLGISIPDNLEVDKW